MLSFLLSTSAVTLKNFHPPRRHTPYSLLLLFITAARACAFTSSILPARQPRHLEKYNTKCKTMPKNLSHQELLEIVHNPGGSSHLGGGGMVWYRIICCAKWCLFGRSTIVWKKKNGSKAVPFVLYQKQLQKSHPKKLCKKVKIMQKM